MLLPVIVVLVIFGPMLRAPFGLIDDHEIVAILGRSDGWLSTLIAYILEQSERFRPLYWVARISEVAVWGWNPGGWYFDRLVLAIAGVLGAYTLAVRFAPRSVAVLAAVALIVGPQAESWYRLGPQEAFAVPLALWGLVAISRGRVALGLALVVAAALTKESFVLFGFVAVAWAWRSDRRAAMVAGLILAAVAVVIEARHLAYPDFYAQPRGPGEVVETATWMLLAVLAIGWPIVAAMILGARHWLMIGVALVVIAPPVYLYAGVHDGRYLFPAILAGVLLLAVGTSEVRRRSPRLGLGIVAAVGLVLLSQASVSYARAEQWAASAQSFTSQMAALRSELRPGTALVVRSSSPDDYETVVAIRRWVPGGTAYLVPPGVGDESPLARKLQADLVMWAVHGGRGYAAGKPSGPCLELDLGSADAPICDRVLSLEP